MPDPLFLEPFLRRPPPRCLAQREAADRDVTLEPLHLRRATWPLRASFTRWGLRLLRERSGPVA